MRIDIENYTFELEEEWINEAGFNPLYASAQHYEADTTKSKNKEMFLIDILEINPNIRNKGICIFNAGEVEGIEKTARERTVSILKAIMKNSKLPPVEVIDSQVEEYRYKLVHGWP